MSAHQTYLEQPRDIMDGVYARLEARRDAEAEAIRDDPERLLEAVYEVDNDEAEKLAVLRIMLANANTVLSFLAEGRTVEEATVLPINAIAFRELLRAAKDCDALVTERVLAAAECAA